MSGVRIARERADRPDVAALIEENRRLSASLYPEDGDFALGPEALLAANVHLLVARDDAAGALGCVALVAQPEDAQPWGELKSVYVAPAARGEGIGRRLMAAAEDAAIGLGLVWLRLETGPLNPDAIALYRRMGFLTCGPFGNYDAGPYSVFMEKRIA